MNMALSREILDKIKSLDGSETWIDEALFGLKQVAPYLKRLPSGSRVLEIGSGGTLLLNQVNLSYTQLSIQGVEPHGPGHTSLSKYQESLKPLGANLFYGGYEEFKSDKKFDLIFLINVFEHLPNWEHFLNFVKSNLNDEGLCIILCPNYGFPYEPHFKIPIIINKTITHFIFQRYIKKFELEEDSDGLWSSLNFVKWRQVKKTCNKLNIECRFGKEIVEDLLRRVENDKTFIKRQPFLSFTVSLLKKTGLLKLLNLPFLYNSHPFMKIEIKSSS